MPQPSTVDFVAPFDPTGFTSITGAQLLQLVSGLYPNTNTGLNLITVDIAGAPQVPDAVTNAKWQNYTWIRQSATYVTAYVWNPNGATDATYLNWVTVSSASIGAGTIQGYMIAPNAIPASAIISISSTQISGSVVPSWLAQLNIGGTAYVVDGLMNDTSPIFGVLNGAGSTVATPRFGTNIIPSTAYGIQSIAGDPGAGVSPIVDNSITTKQLLSNGGAASIAATNAAVDPKTNIIVPTTSIPGIPSNTSIPQAAVTGDVLGIGYNANAAQLGFVTISRALLNLADPASVANAIQIPLVLKSAIAYTAQNFGNIVLQNVIELDNTATRTQLACALTAVPNLTTGPTALEIAGLKIAFTPISAASTLFIEASVQISTSNLVSDSIVSLFLNSAGASLASVTGAATGGSNKMATVVLRYQVASGSTAARTYSIGLSASNGTYYAQYNSTDGATKLFGGTLGTNSSLRITEIL
jgi:hypothetical protein